ncbi:MAG TPA: hypothetical protein VFT47_11280 [Vicinamibacterales bacterium]|nr:hypothetical protein [Vicinamibacterales bacterium]
MRRLAGILLIAAMAAAPVAADVTITTVTTIEGAMVSPGSGGITSKVVVQISGTKSRMDIDTGDQVLATISDTATNQAYLLRPGDKTAQLLDTAGSPDFKAGVVAGIDASVTPTGQKRDINGVSCDEYAVTMQLDLASVAGGGSALPPEAASMLKDVFLHVTGSIWAAKDAPGAAEYATFQKTAARLAAAAAGRTVSAGAAGPAPIPSGMDRLLTGFPEASGIPYLTDLTTKLQGTGPLVALMQQMGQMKIIGKVESVSTEPVPADLFNVPEGYTIVK